MRNKATTEVINFTTVAAIIDYREQTLSLVEKTHTKFDYYLHTILARWTAPFVADEIVYPLTVNGV